MKYFLKKKGEQHYQDVSKEDYVNAERMDGFYNTLGCPEEPATSAFGGMLFEGYTEFESIADFNVPNRHTKGSGHE